MCRDRRRAFLRASWDAMDPAAGAPGGDADAAMSTGARAGRVRRICRGAAARSPSQPVQAIGQARLRERLWRLH
jgi:hypothetical protein